MGSTTEVAKFAIGSRLIVIVLQFVFTCVIPEHNADAFRSPLLALEASRWSTADQLVQRFFKGLTRWDSQYFLHIAQFDYTYEHMVAFFPGYPLLVRILAQTMQDMLGDVLSQSSWVLLSCVIVSNTAFVLSALALFYLTQLIFLDDRHLPLKAAKLYCFNPASIFFSSCYTESLFAFVTFVGLYFLEMEHDSLATMMFFFGSITRSNATLVPIFYLQKIIRRYRRGRYYVGLVIRAGLACAGNLLVQLYFWDRFCFPHQVSRPPREVQLLAAGMGYKEVGSSPSEWCFSHIPLSYGYVQSKYWNVGLLKYWQLKQVPNFLLALPIGVLVLNFCREHRKRLPSYCIHAALLGAICFFVANVQVATRLLISASPVPLWAAARSANPMHVWTYFLLYFVLGILLHSNFFPWT